MANQKDPTVLTNLLIQTLVPALIFIGSAAVAYSQVSDLKQSAKKTLETLQSMSERLVKVETKVQVLFDERKEGK